MLGNNELAEAAEAIKVASQLTETTFLHVGKTLETSIEILARLSRNFDTLLAELQNENLEAALRALERAAARVADLGHGTDGSGFDRLQVVAEAIARRILKMNKSVKTVDSLAIAAKIAATDIRTSEIDFSTFAEQIACTLHLTRTSLDSFAEELTPVRSRVANARVGQQAFQIRRQEAARSIPPRLVATVDAIHRQHKQAAKASAAVTQRSERVRQQICSAVMALQIGDSTRQRLEHTDCALTLVRQLPPPEQDGSVRETPRPLAEARTSEAGDQTALTAAEQQDVVSVIYRLQSAQLADAAQAFDRDVRQITASLETLSAEALALRNLGSSAFGSSERGGSTVIHELEGQVGEALDLLEDFCTAQATASQVVGSVSDSTKGLCSHLRNVQSLEADIRIMSLNTTLKCSRVGREGLALSLIAQELRTYANEFAKEAGALMHEVENVGQITVALTADNASDAAPLIAEVMHAMKHGLATLRQVGQTLGDTLAELERDSEEVIALLGETATNLGRHDEIGHALRQAAAVLATLSATIAAPTAILAPRAQQMLEAMADGYTMENERLVYDRVLGNPPRAASAATVAAPEMEDMLF